MKSAGYKYLSGIIIAVFLLYWVASIALTLSHATQKDKLAKIFPRADKVLGNGWNFFSRDLNYNNRMYCILRDHQTNKATDTVEILQEMAALKRQHAPFNQSDIIFDHLVGHYLGSLTGIIKNNDKILHADFPTATDSFYYAAATDMAIKNPHFNEWLSTLNNYCRTILAKKNIDTTGKQYKILITEKYFRPFAERNNEKFVAKETVLFESLYKPFNQ